MQASKPTWRLLLAATLVAVMAALGINYSAEMGVLAGYTYDRMFGSSTVVLGGTRYQMPENAWVIATSEQRVTLGFLQSFGKVGLLHVLLRAQKDPQELLLLPTKDGKVAGPITPIEVGRLGVRQQCFQTEYRSSAVAGDRAMYCPSSGLLFSARAEDSWVWPHVVEVLDAMSAKADVRTDS